MTLRHELRYVTSPYGPEWKWKWSWKQFGGNVLVLQQICEHAAALVYSSITYPGGIWGVLFYWGFLACFPFHPVILIFALFFLLVFLLLPGNKNCIKHKSFGGFFLAVIFLGESNCQSLVINVFNTLILYFECYVDWPQRSSKVWLHLSTIEVVVWLPLVTWCLESFSANQMSSPCGGNNCFRVTLVRKQMILEAGWGKITFSRDNLSEKQNIQLVEKLLFGFTHTLLLLATYRILSLICVHLEHTFF